MTYQLWYRAGTATLTNGSTAVAGTLTAWATDIRPGDAISVDGTRWAEIASVNSNTSLTLVTAWGGATNSGAYMIDRRSVLRQIGSDIGAKLAAYLEVVKVFPPPTLAGASKFPRVNTAGDGYDLVAGLLAPLLAAAGADAKKLVVVNAAGTALEYAVGITSDGNDITVPGAVRASSTIELGHATDTTLSRSAAGRVAVEGVDLLMMSDANAVSYTPTVTASDGPLVSYSINKAKYVKIGKMVLAFADVNLTDVGGRNAALLISAPVAVESGLSGNLGGREAALTGVLLGGQVSSTDGIFITKADGTTILANGRRAIVTAMYIAA